MYAIRSYYVLLLPGCTLHRPQQATLPAPLPATYVEQAAETVPVPAVERWWENFADAWLNALRITSYNVCYTKLLRYLVTDRELCLGRPLEEVVVQAVAGGCTMIQLREKDLNTGEFVELARALRTRLEPTGIPLLVNDRVDVALAADVQGVHVGQSDMKPADIRRLMGPNAIIGFSVETCEELAAAQYEPRNNFV